MKWTSIIFISLCLVFVGCVQSKPVRHTFKLEAEIHSENFLEKPKYEIVGRINWEIK